MWGWREGATRSVFLELSRFTTKKFTSGDPLSPGQARLVSQILYRETHPGGALQDSGKPGIPVLGMSPRPHVCHKEAWDAKPPPG